MVSYLFLIGLFGIAVVVGSSYNRHIKELEPALHDEYAKAKFVPTSILILLFLIGLLPIAFFRWTTRGIIIAKVYLSDLYCRGVCFLQVRKERKRRKAHLPPAFIRKTGFTT